MNSFIAMPIKYMLSVIYCLTVPVLLPALQISTGKIPQKVVPLEVCLPPVSTYALVFPEK